jgi:hypothetical protein
MDGCGSLVNQESETGIWTNNIKDLFPFQLIELANKE